MTIVATQPISSKVCICCKDEKSIRDFNYGSCHRRICHACRNAKKREWSANNLQLARLRYRNSYNRRREHNVRSGKYYINRWVIEATRRNKKRGRDGDLTKEYLTFLWQEQDGKCAVTGLAFDLSGKRNPLSPSIDRIDASIEYKKGNVRFVVLAMNCAFGAWGQDAFYEIAKSFCDRYKKANRA